jgi:hypothetical protein
VFTGALFFPILLWRSKEVLNECVLLKLYFCFCKKHLVHFLHAQEVDERKAPPDNFSTEFTFAHVLSLELLVQACVEPSDFLIEFANSNSSEKLKAG